MAVRRVVLFSRCQSVCSPLTHWTTYSEREELLGGVHSNHSRPPWGHTFSSATGGGSDTHTLILNKVPL